MVVHAVYVGVIRPSAVRLAIQAAQQTAGGTDRQPVARHCDQGLRTGGLLYSDALGACDPGSEGLTYTIRSADAEPRTDCDSRAPASCRDAREQSRPSKTLPEEEQDYLLPRALNALGLYHNIQHTAVSDAVRGQCDISRSPRPELSMVRYISWAIPSISFIGTVRGTALGQTYKAVEGDISGVTVSLRRVQWYLRRAGALDHHHVRAAPTTVLGAPVLNTQRYIDRHLPPEPSGAARLMKLLDCNDASLRLWHEGKAIWSPGIAWLNDGRYQFGQRLEQSVEHRAGQQPILAPALYPATGPHWARRGILRIWSMLTERSGSKHDDLTLIIPRDGA